MRFLRLAGWAACAASAVGCQAVAGIEDLVLVDDGGNVDATLDGPPADATAHDVGSDAEAGRDAESGASADSPVIEVGGEVAPCLGTPDSCGPSGQCSSCLGVPGGSACVTTGGLQHCGCTVAADCPMFTACTTTVNLCGTQCGAASTSPCNGGCCDLTSLSCTTGSSAASCGASGGPCLSCLVCVDGGPLTPGTKCLAVDGGGHCGCVGDPDCCYAPGPCCINHVCQ